MKEIINKIFNKENYKLTLVVFIMSLFGLLGVGEGVTNTIIGIAIFLGLNMIWIVLNYIEIKITK